MFFAIWRMIFFAENNTKNDFSWVFTERATNILQLLCYTVMLDLVYRGIVLNTDLAEAAFS